MPSLRTLQVEAGFWFHVFLLRSNSPTAVFGTGRSSRLSLRTCRKYFKAVDGRSWIPAAVCGGGRWIAITGKMSHSDLASSWDDRVQLRSSTPTPTRESRIDVNPFTVRLNLHGDLDFFIRKGAPGRTIERPLNEKTSVKDAIEACGVAHPEIDFILVKGQTV